jgi:glycosyltransferase involved in cell wall biosynthesis
MTRASVVLPTYNRAGVLPRAIASVLAQTERDLELIVVDDGSTDETANVVAALSDSRIRYVRNARRDGVSRARNRGIELAQSDWVAFQDSDDAWQPHRLERQWALIADNVALIVTRDRVVNDAALSYDDGALGTADVIDLSSRVQFRLPPAATWLARRSALLAAGGFDATLDCYEDWELALRLRRQGRIVLVNRVLVERTRTPGSLFSNEPARLRNLEQIVAQHRDTLRADPQAWAYYCNALGQMSMQAGRAREGRRWFREALGARLLDLRAWSNVVASLFGSSAFERYVALVRGARRLAHGLRGSP